MSVSVQFDGSPAPVQVQIEACLGASIPTPEGGEFMTALEAVGVVLPAGSYGGGCDMARRSDG